MDLEKLDELADIMDRISIWKPASVTQEPETKLTQWQVYKVKALGEETIHFNGYARYEGRVCSAVQEFDKTTMRGRTKSGRIYELVGEPGRNRDAEYVWNDWIGRIRDHEITCITEEYI
jgi:hypothetical protein